MPPSPYETTVNPPIHSLAQIEKQYYRQIAKWDDEDDAAQELLDMAALLIRYSDFLESKLEIKKRLHDQLAKRCDELEKVSKTFKEILQTQGMEITALKSELEKAGAVTGTNEQLGSDSDDTGVESSSRDVSGWKPEEGEHSLESTGLANPRKRGAEVDDSIDRNAMKKRRTGNVRDLT